MTGRAWSLVLSAAALGVGYGGVTVMGWIHGAERWVVLLMIIGVAARAVGEAPRMPVLAALAGGFALALAAIWTQAAFLPIYFDNNPTYRAAEIPFGLSARAFTTLFAPLGGLAAGLICALIAFVFSLVFRRWRRADGSSPDEEA